MTRRGSKEKCHGVVPDLTMAHAAEAQRGSVDAERGYQHMAGRESYATKKLYLFLANERQESAFSYRTKKGRDGEGGCSEGDCV